MSATSVFLHSTGTGPFLWDAVPAEVLGTTERRAVVNLGYPPLAPLPRGTACTLEDETTHVLAQIGDAEEVHLYAHSYGGLVALEALRRLGRRARSVFLYEPVVFGALARATGDDLDADAVAEAKILVDHPWFLHDEARGGTEAWLEVFVDYWNRPGSWARIPAFMREHNLAVGWKMFQEVRSCFFDARPFAEYAALAVPLTLAMGGRSPKTSRAMAKALARHNPGARLVEIGGTGHMAPMTHPALVHGAMEEHARWVRSL